MARLSEDQINEIRAKADIVEVISHYVPLTRKGKNYVCTCPFHDDHDPSLSISSDKQIFKCFVCGTGGNVFTFVQKFEQISFIEAVYHVAQLVGMPLDEATIASIQNERKVDTKLASIYKVNQETIEFCEHQLTTPVAAKRKAYLQKRGISDEVMKQFQIGYLPEGNSLYRFLHAKRFTDEEMLRAGVCQISANGIKDVFSDRIMIPIHDAFGHPVGFTARRSEDSMDAKYINTSQTEVYEKGKLIFNYHRAKVAIKECKKVILTEGAMDVIAFAKVGIHSAIATLGTACTLDQIKLMKNLRVPVVVCYDGDKAGQEATYKFGQLAIANGLPIEIVNNQVGLDPDEIIEVYGKEELIQMSERTISWVEFLFQFLQTRYQLENYSQRKEFAIKISEAIHQMQNDFEKQSAYVKLQELTGFDMRVSDVKTETAPKKPHHNRKQTMFLSYPKDGATSAQFTILSQMLVSISASNMFRDELGFLIDETCKKLAYYIVDFYRSHVSMDVSMLLDRIEEEKVKSLLLEVSQWELARDDYDKELLQDAIKRMHMIMIDERIRKINETIATISDMDIKAKLGEEKNALIRKKGGMREWQSE